MHHDAIYLMAFTAHMVAIIYGLRVIHKLEPLFINSCPRSIFKSTVEQHFWTLIIAISVNFLSIWQLWPRWYNDRMILTNDLIYVINHIATGILCIFFHRITLKELRKRLIGWKDER